MSRAANPIGHGRRRRVRRLARREEEALRVALDLDDDEAADLSATLATMRRRAPSRRHAP